MNPVGRAFASRTVVLVRADINQGGGVAVVGRLQHNQITMASVGASQPQRQFIGLAAGVDEKADLQRSGQGGTQQLGVSIHEIVQIAGVGIQQGHLFAGRAHYLGMTVANVGHVVIGINVAASIVFKKVLHPAAHDLYGLAVGDA